MLSEQAALIGAFGSCRRKKKMKKLREVVRQTIESYTPPTDEVREVIDGALRLIDDSRKLVDLEDKAEAFEAVVEALVRSSPETGFQRWRPGGVRYREAIQWLRDAHERRA